jgi:hypothetical protein
MLRGIIKIYITLCDFKLYSNRLKFLECHVGPSQPD